MMAIYIMILTGIMLMFTIVQCIAERMHVKRLSRVHNIIIELEVINIARKAQRGQLTFRCFRLVNSIRKAYVKTDRNQKVEKTLSRKYSFRGGVIVHRLVNSTTNIIHIG